MSNKLPCTRCSLPEEAHPVGSYTRDGQASYCLRYDPPAPAWMRGLLRVLEGRRA